MKNKKIKLAIYTILIIIFLSSLFFIFRTGKQSITVENVSNYYSGSNLEAVISVKNKKTFEPMKSSLKIQLLDKDNKKVKGINEKQKLGEGESLNVSLKLPEKLQTGSYTLKIISKSGFYKDVAKVPVNISKDKESEIIISLDKGIYKPGDEVNFRALLISKKENTPLHTDNVSLSIFDGNDNRVYNNTTKTSDYGIVTGCFKLGDEVNSGNYRIVVTTENQELSKEFIVNPYVTPKFEVSVSSDKDTYVIGEKAKVTFNAKYFFGEPVKNANIKGTIDGVDFVGITGEDGTFTKEIDITKAGAKKILAEIEDSSNYFVEASKTIYGSTDIYEIQILPEYSNLIKGIDNNVYVITKTADNKPVKTYATVTIGTITREVITDDNGVGKFTLTSSDLDNFNSSRNVSIKVVSQDMQENRVTKSTGANVLSNTGTIVVTDKVEYEENEDIKVNLVSSTDLAQKEIFITKGKELIKTVSSENSEFSFNLEGISGLIDIYVPERINRTTPASYRYNSVVNRVYDDYIYEDYEDYEVYDDVAVIKNPNIEYNKKTIFIKPNKTLNIEIETDKETYSPRENLNINFTTTDEGNKAIDSALLVSILDEAVLSLAENDLSIDNLKVALQDIKLSEGVTLADLYASVLNSSDETLLKSMLLKQYNSSQNIIQRDYVEEDSIEKAILVAIISGALIAIVASISISKKASKGAKTIKGILVALLEIFVIFIIIATYCGEALSDLFYEFRAYELITMLTCLVISIIAYNLILYKQKSYIFELIKKLCIAPIIFFIFFAIVGIIEQNTYQDKAIGYAILILLGFIAIISIASRFLKESKVFKFLSKVLKELLPSGIFWIAVLVICTVIDSTIGFLLVLAAYIFIDKYVFRKTETRMENGKIVFNINMNEFVGVAIGFIFILIVVKYFYGVTRSFSKPIKGGAISDFDQVSSGYTWSDSIKDNSVSFSEVDTAAPSGSSILSSMQSQTDKFIGKNSSSNTESIENAKNEASEVVAEEIEKEAKKEETVRNIFLESLAFIPELVTENGKANLTLGLSDNITTWNIQTVGNTKEGNLGFGNKTFKVFKEFFVDFSLPTNAVVSDNISIPVTLYNYTEGDLNIAVEVKQNDWSNIGEYTKTVLVPAKSTQNIYVPIEILKQGDNTLRVESKAGNISDIVEKTMKVKVNGFQKEKVVSSGSMEQKLEQDIIFKEKAIDGTSKIKLKLYPSPIAQIVEGMENVLQMPTGCFEQTSSSLYPDILVLKYLEDNKLSNETIKAKALDYINAGYQKLLTYEVKGTKGGYSLYGRNPAETVITAFGLMEMQDLSEVYDVDEHVIENMKEFLFKRQKINGSFEYDSTYIGGASNTNDLAMNAYIIWALSEACPNDSRLTKSINYLESKLDDVNDNYTLALIANAFSNTKHKQTKSVIDRILKNIKMVDNQNGYIETKVRDYYGCYGSYANIQATALTSMVLSKEKSNSKTNSALINYIISMKDTAGTWHNTQATILALKALNDFNTNTDISNQTIKVTFNGEQKSIDVKDNYLDIYEFDFDNVSQENKIAIEMKKGQIQYEIIKEYYQDYTEAVIEYGLKSSDIISVKSEMDNTANVNDVITQRIKLTNLTNDRIANAIVRINIPQGCTVVEDSLLKLEHNKTIEKFEYNYGTINLYLRETTKGKTIDLEVKYRASFPEKITGGAIRAYDYYNPEIEGICAPAILTVNQ